MALEVLVVDDEADIRELVAGVLEDEGYAVRSAADSTSALEAIDDRRPSLVLLDVFAEEPLPVDHPFWRHPRVLITPHVAADTVPEEAVAQIAANLHALASGQPPRGAVDRQRGY